MSSSGSTAEIHSHVVETERCGKLKVWVQGDIELARKNDKEGGKPVFMTVHDIGKNHNSWLNFVYHPSMMNVRDRSVFIHVDLLGQEDDAEDLTAEQKEKYANMQFIGEDLVNILDNLRVKMVIGLGDGAGANIMARFAAMHVTRCLGVVLINPTATPATFFDHFKGKISSRMPKTASSTENYLLLHKFGYELAEGETEDESITKSFDEYKERLRTAKLNERNAHVYVQAYMDRDDLTARVKQIQDDMLLVCGNKSSYASQMDAFFAGCNKAKTSCLKIDDVGDVLEEAPAKMANSLLLFCKGLGWLTSLANAGVERHRTASQSSTGSGGGGGAGSRRMSMEEYDKPNLRRLSLTGSTPAGGPLLKKEESTEAVAAAAAAVEEKKE